MPRAGARWASGSLYAAGIPKKSCKLKMKEYVMTLTPEQRRARIAALEQELAELRRQEYEDG